MAGHKGPGAKDDETKKRKRDTNESETKSKTKRHRQQGQGDKVNGHDKALESGRLIEADSLRDATNYRPREVIRQSDDGEAGWRISKPMGGRMLDIDPILTTDEQHLILTYNTSLQIYSAADSLLVRRIPISTLDTSAPQGSTPTNIVATRLSTQNPDFVWVACSDGQIYHVNWTHSAKVLPAFQTDSGTAKAMVVVPAEGQKEEREAILVAESDKPNRMEVNAYQGITSSKPKVRFSSILVLKKTGSGLQLLEASANGRILIGAFHDRLFLGVASQGGADELDGLRYEFFSFDAPDLIATLDLRIYTRPVSTGGSRKTQVGTDTVVDIVAGGARGGIYIYRDALSRVQVVGNPQFVKDGIQVQKFHWHRKAVHSVKWSRDGNYFVSGGSENCLVIWQVDTAKRGFLPHLSGSVENIVVSASGSSYVLHLDDNSAMIISTAEMKPTAYISGIQSAAIDVATPKDLLVKRVWSAAEQVRRPIPAAINPSDSSKLHVCVGNGRQATMTGDFSAPLLQSFNLETFTSVSKQALARTQPTDVNITKKGYAIDEPLVSHIAFSGDGKWLASVDEWKPSARDVENVSSDLRDEFIRERHEIYLKFWEVGDGEGSMALVSRINAPHTTSHQNCVLDLASDSTSTCFATIGGDGIVRLWRPKLRQQNGIASKDAAGQDTVSWGCSQVIAVEDYLGRETGTDMSTTPAKAQGSVTFSEDGSTLFAAFGAVDTGVVYVIDTASGQIVKTLEGLWEGQLQSIRALSSFVIVLSNDLRVYDVVSDELRYGIVIPKIPGVTELLQIAVDYSSGHFAVTLPVGGFSSIGVFDPEHPEPLLVRSTPHRIVSLVSAPAASGFIALDDAAQIWVIAEGSDPSALATVQPLQDLQLDGPAAAAEEGGKDIIPAMEDAEMASDDEMEEEQADEDDDMDMDDDGFYPSVVPQQHLADIFDAAPAFAAPSVEDMFYKVTGLLATKPLSATSA
ncbi:U3 small nucleolar RNA-associated protein 17 [Tolypocladium capitatum]|uniref:U3 small nucleolar RNA-associated protein 17 n=1 Tax=Tolypocladium capitatum TaxID=45235 RepID=A0A2K3QNV8_9HYPO|nr:U3 small nucleolar RNA-associated protein 17 [Tolypocladium capitatum]PNY29225.1 U3 small nucleolar RNA-associated protein 17 [Tolypocladium capitatum]